MAGGPMSFSAASVFDPQASAGYGGLNYGAQASAPIPDMSAGLYGSARHGSGAPVGAQGFGTPNPTPPGSRSLTPRMSPLAQRRRNGRRERSRGHSDDDIEDDTEQGRAPDPVGLGTRLLAAERRIREQVHWLAAADVKMNQITTLMEQCVAQCSVMEKFPTFQHTLRVLMRFNPSSWRA